MITNIWFAAILSLSQPVHATNFDYSGLPVLSNASISMQGVNVSFKLTGRTATTTELILFKNSSTTPIDTTLLVPRFRLGGEKTVAPAFPVTATWNKQPMTLVADSGDVSTPPNTIPSNLKGSVHFGAGETAALRIQYSTSFGTTGYGRNQAVVGFAMADSQVAIPQINVSFGYSQGTVFDLPMMAPSWQWQIGKTGAAVRLSNFTPKGELVTATFYTAGFHSIH